MPETYYGIFEITKKTMDFINFTKTQREAKALKEHYESYEYIIEIHKIRILIDKRIEKL